MTFEAFGSFSSEQVILVTFLRRRKKKTINSDSCFMRSFSLSFIIRILLSYADHLSALQYIIYHRRGHCALTLLLLFILRFSHALYSCVAVCDYCRTIIRATNQHWSRNTRNKDHYDSLKLALWSGLMSTRQEKCTTFLWNKAGSNNLMVNSV